MVALQKTSRTNFVKLELSKKKKWEGWQRLSYFMQKNFEHFEGREAKFGFAKL